MFVSSVIVLNLGCKFLQEKWNIFELKFYMILSLLALNKILFAFERDRIGLRDFSGPEAICPTPTQNSHLIDMREQDRKLGECRP